MLSRALRLATVTLLAGCFAAGAVRAQNLDAGKSPSQIFSSTCSACHKSPRGLLKNTPASSLPGFLRQHYTTGTDMASVLSAYLISNGAADPRYQGREPSRRDARRDARQDLRPDPREDTKQDARQDSRDARTERPERISRRRPAAAPEADSAAQGEDALPRRDARQRYGRPRVAPAEGQAPVQAATDGKPRLRQKGRRGKPVPDEAPKTEQVTPGNTASDDEPSRDVSRSESAVTEAAKPLAAKPDDPARSDPASTDAIGSGVREMSESNPLRPDPVMTAPFSAAVAPQGAPAATSAPAGPPTPPISR
jgi:hypothetical protein